MLKPEKLNPVCKEILWGGNRLKEEYGKHSDGANIAESWELTCRTDGMNTIVGGENDGLTLENYIKKSKINVVGTKNHGDFPLLIKFIDACADLSVQVHPNDEYAKKVNSFGKTEMWYILDAKPGAKLVYGLKEGKTAKTLSLAIENQTVEDELNYVEVKKGDVFFIPSGLVHAIGGGILLAEIQQNSNITYRVYDYNRKGKDGKPRELHIADALNVICTRTQEEIEKIRFSSHRVSENTLASCPFFDVCRYDLSNQTLSLTASEESFHSLLCLEGQMSIEYNGKSYPLVKGDSYFIPATMGAYEVNGCGQIIVSQI